MLYPDAGIVPPGSYQEKVLQAANAPFYVNGRVHMAPTFTWGSRISSDSEPDAAELARTTPADSSTWSAPTTSPSA